MSSIQNNKPKYESAGFVGVEVMTTTRSISTTSSFQDRSSVEGSDPLLSSTTSRAA
jgi:hypothetical protein